MLKINLRTVDLNLLRIFLEIWKTKNLTIAGDNLAMTQPAVSHALRRLRDLFNDPLFVRTTDGMLPTDAAIRLYEPIDHALCMINTTLQSHTSFDPLKAERIFKLSMSDMSEFFFLPNLLAQLEEKAPHIHFEIKQVPLHNLEKELRSGEIDMAIGYYPGLSTECHSHLLLKDQHICMTRASHPLLGEGELTLECLNKFNYVFANSGATGHQMIEECFKEHHIKRNIVLRLPHFTIAPEIIKHADLAVIFPLSIAKRFNDNDIYALKSLPFEMPDIDVRLYWHQRFNFDEGIKWLKDIFMQHTFPYTKEVTLLPHKMLKNQ